MNSLGNLNTKFGWRYGEISNLSFKDIYDILMLRNDVPMTFRVKSLKDILDYRFQIEGYNTKDPYAYITWIELELQELKLRYEEGLVGNLENMVKDGAIPRFHWSLIKEQLNFRFPQACEKIIRCCKKLEKCLEEDNEKRIPIA
jgi:hypothetical protein